MMKSTGSNMASGKGSPDATRGPQQGYCPSVSDFQVFRTLNTSRDFGEFKKNIGRFLERLGFDEYVFARMHTEGNVEPHLITTSLEMRQSYYNAGLYEHSLIDQYIKNNTQPIFQSTIQKDFENISFKTDFTECNREIFTLLRKFNYNDFYFMPSQAFNGNGNAVLSVAHCGLSVLDFRKKVKKVEPTLRQLSEAVDYIGTRKFARHFLSEEESPTIAITPRPLQILTIMAQEDMSLQETADHLGRSVHTLNQQVAAARKAFGVDTTHGAIYQAIREGLIDCEKKPSQKSSS
ncbi:helix-turn-helix transcriptional regulator [Eilatimonas milleporae]|uniref:Autoinducer binding domain-containing protein n=1 Tax=Eilatimonas milleporae TaxID=911205 RepID=A0A3M0C6W1_9PROT|nr:autoinducer binding domain-containing protein [Eilatimonas milleporae]RMB02819.1 autoinducer binding domain-containing protein [Eilatimonas milleporae]